jgi:ribonucleoside-diphosphate reductase beta chain
MIFEEQIALEPDHYSWAQTFIDTAFNGFWTDKEFNFSSDKQDFKVHLTPQEQQIIVRSLSLIGQLEISVKKFWSKLGDNVPHPSLFDLGYVLSMQEVVHGNAYKRLLNVLGIKNSFDEILKMDFIKGRVNYLRKHLHKFHDDNKKQFVYSLILFTLFIENIALFSQFYTISWFGRFKNVLVHTNKQVEYTSREENLHAQVGIKLINVIRQEHPELFDDALLEKVMYEGKNAVEYECEIIGWTVNGYKEDALNSDVVRELVKHRMNNSLAEIGFPKMFEIDQELISKTTWFNEQLLGNNKTDFFHSRPVEYSKKAHSFSEDDLF